MTFTFYHQPSAMDCGPTCIRMVAKYYGKHYNADTLRNIAGFNKEGVSLLGISETAEKIGFRTRGVQLTTEQLKQVTLPCILHWNQNHFVVLVSIKRNKFTIADPAKSIISYNLQEFTTHWAPSRTEINEAEGVALLLEPMPSFYENEGEKEHKLSWKLVLQYLARSKWQIAQVLAALLITSGIQLIFPLLTQSIVDNGISVQNLQYVVVVLLAQLMLTFSKTFVDFIRSRLLLRISNILNLQILSDFWIKLTHLPVSYFDVHHTGDTLQRISDHRQIQNFLTGTALTTLFSVFNFIVYAIVLVIYNVELFFIFCIGSILYFGWVQLFLKIRRKINYQTFHLSAKENNATLQLIQGMQEIRLNNAGKQKRWEWENIQAAVFKLNFKNLNYSQWQQAGATLINQIQDLAISFIVAKLVIDGQLTLGAMLAVQYIIGQLSGPVNQWVSFVQSAQDARISMERLNEIHQLPDEEDQNKIYNNHLPENKSITLKNISFTYPGAGNEPVLSDINLVIPEGKVTAIVGISGSGKTTLLKLLLKIYEPQKGEIRIGATTNGNDYTKNGKRGLRFDYISPSYWRQQCGSVMQDGYIFNDTIARNIAVGDENIQYGRLVVSCETANILSFVESLPNGFYTQLGSEGTGLSQGQKQRLLIARAVYKNPEYLFFDEATNALDANNEKEIVENLASFFEGKTVVIAAHRLSTVKNADKIVVLHQGKIAEEGTHDSLAYMKGKYYELVKNQLELGNE
ncbi:MAG TPA: peptidase domain-containing ABC transporter [Chitinophagaceae bacterium]|nr:peptidase domain-containing ABC transporter [Chitinophagaceae bacterium]